ncbi:MAG: DUF4345 domain-containing protein, partial [Woeseiaceae bacterium]
MEISNLRSMLVSRLVLLVSGLVASGIAVAILIAPDAFYASYGIELGGDNNLTNELKAPAGALLLAGATILAGSIRTRLIVLSMTTAAAVYLSFGLSRFLSMIVDGVPHDSLVSA